MDFSNLALFNVMKAKLNYMSERQSVLAQNVANVDTPGYQAKDIEMPDFKKLVGNARGTPNATLPMQTTNSQHLSGGSGGIGSFQVEKRKSTYELNPTGNNVSIEEEMMKVAENQAEYQKVLNLYRKTVDMFKTAIGRPTGG